MEQIGKLLNQPGILVPLKQDAIAISKTDLKPQDLCLLNELALTAENGKTQIGPELQAEFLRTFANESPTLLRRAFQSWRMRSNFAPSVRDIWVLVEEEGMALYQEREAIRLKEWKADRDAALREWERPEVKSEHERIVAEVKANFIPPPVRRENVIALSQASALKRIGEAMRANQPCTQDRSGVDGAVLVGVDTSCVGESK